MIQMFSLHTTAFHVDKTRNNRHVILSCRWHRHTKKLSITVSRVFKGIYGYRPIIKVFKRLSLTRREKKHVLINLKHSTLNSIKPFPDTVLFPHQQILSFLTPRIDTVKLHHTLPYTPNAQLQGGVFCREAKVTGSKGFTRYPYGNHEFVTDV